MSEAHSRRHVVIIANALGRGGVERGASNAALGFQAHGFATRIAVTDVASVGRRAPGGTAEFLAEVIADERVEPELVHLHAHRLDWALVERARHRWSTATFVEQSIWSRPMPSTRLADVIVHYSPWMMACFRARTALRRRTSRSIVLGAPVAWTPRLESDPSGGASTRPPTDLIAEARARFRSAHGLDQNAVLVGRVGQAVGDKWDPVLVDAFEQVASSNPAVHLLLVAAPRFVLEQVRSLPEELRSRVIMIDWIDTDDALSEIYAAMDVFAHAARRGESFGFVLIEAMAARVPVLTLSTPEADNAQVDWVLETGAGLAASSRRSFVALLRDLVEDRERRQRLVGRGVGFESRFAPAAFVARLLESMESNQEPASRSILAGPRAQLATLQRIGPIPLRMKFLIVVRPWVAWSYKTDRLWTEVTRRMG
jgi:glycosyltransferase involved in cell wall biosynthesis